MSTGTFVLGLLNGMTIGLLAVGLVLVYKSNRFINLAHAQMGTLSALLLAKWVLEWGWSWWAAFGLAIVVGVVTALLVERFMVRPLRRRKTSPVRMLLLTIGVSQLLLADLYPEPGPWTERPVLPAAVHLSLACGICGLERHVGVNDGVSTGAGGGPGCLLAIFVVGEADQGRSDQFGCGEVMRSFRESG